MTTSSKLFKMITLALLGTISFILFFISFPLPFLPPFLKVDFGDIPALLATLMFSPLAGVGVVGIKNFLYLVIGGGDPVGVVASFLAGVMFVLPLGLLYKRYEGMKGIVLGLVAGTVVTALGMSILNYLVILPIYALFMGMEEMALEQVKRMTVLIGILPFNLIKGTMVSFLFVPLYTKMSQWITEKRREFA